MILTVVIKKPRIKATKKTTFPLSTGDHILKDIKKEAKEEGISVNSKINIVLSQYVIWYRHTQQQGSITIPNKNFQFMIDHIDETLLLEAFMANTVNLDLFFRAKNIPFTLDNFIKYGFEGAGLYGGLFHVFSHYKDDYGQLCFFLEHNYGIKWSRILNAIFGHQIKSMLNYTTTSEILPSSVIIKILEKNV